MARNVLQFVGEGFCLDARIGICFPVLRFWFWLHKRLEQPLWHDPHDCTLEMAILTSQSHSTSIWAFTVAHKSVVFKSANSSGWVTTLFRLDFSAPKWGFVALPLTLSFSFYFLNLLLGFRAAALPFFFRVSIRPTSAKSRDIKQKHNL